MQITDSPAPFGYIPLSIFVPPIGCPSNCDDGAFIFNVPSFTYDGASYSQVIWSVNGTIEAGTASGLAASANNRSMPDATPPNNLIAPFWTDLDLTGITKVRFINLGVEYRNVDGPYSGRAGTTTSTRARSNQTEFQLDEATQQMFEEEISGAFREEIERSSILQIVDEPGPDVLDVHIGLLDVVSRVPPETVGRSRIFIDRVGEATLVLELRDSILVEIGRHDDAAFGRPELVEQLAGTPGIVEQLPRVDADPTELTAHDRNGVPDSLLEQLALLVVVQQREAGDAMRRRRERGAQQAHEVSS